jgi:ABC-type multidrug transport system ATPase subunit
MLTLRDVTHVYADGTRAPDPVSLEIGTGMFGVLGPNGAGKSTVMRSIAALQTPNSGTFRFGDIEVIREPAKLRAIRGYLPQDFGVYPHVSAYEFLDHLALLKGFTHAAKRREMLEALLNQVNLWGARRRAVASLSGGMLQRFGIAQALIGSPALIIVDEPTAGLDSEERNRLSNLMAQIGEQAVVILSTHLVDDVADLCSRMAIIHEGRVRVEGAPQDLTTRLRGRLWRRVVRREALEELKAGHRVIKSRLQAGQTLVHVLAESAPEGFEGVQGGLEDLHFATLSDSRPAAA